MMPISIDVRYRTRPFQMSQQQFQRQLERQLMTTAEVAAYLRLRERKVYDLVASGRIPCTRVTGKLLFPKPLIDLWIASETDGGGLPRIDPRPPIAVGSHDPLLDWAIGKADTGADAGIATLFGGSLDGLRRFLEGQALFCGLHVPDAASDDPMGEDANTHLFASDAQAAGAAARVVLIEWARRRQGLFLPKGNPRGIASLSDLAGSGARLRPRGVTAGSRVLLDRLIADAGLDGALVLDTVQADSETDAATAVADGEADAAFGIAAAARRFDLDFVPLAQERFDIAVDRRDYFEPPFQALLSVTRSAEFTEHAEKLGGYDVSKAGRVVFNG